jgi:hypothetical protein
MTLSKALASTSSPDVTLNHLAEEEQKLRVRIAATSAKAEQAVSPQFHAARLYRDGARKRHDEAMRNYRAAQEQLAAAPDPHRSVMDRLLGRPTSNDAVEALGRHAAAAHADLIAAEHSLTSAEANLARVQKFEAEERRRLMEQAETERRHAMELLAEVTMAQRMVKAFPSLVYSGPAFVRWAGGRTERKRQRAMRNPFATNIWGLPINPGY